MFNPFNKPLENVNEQDLKVLFNVSEGWYVEYKKELPNPKDIAKSISSFANSYGGLFIIGIEADKVSNCCKNIVGVNFNIDKIRDSVRGNLQPFPFFKTYVIPLSSHSNVVIVDVMEGSDPPYVHSSGRIYRRQDAASDPVFEKDRYTIDSLYKKSEKLEAIKSDFIKMDYSTSINENDIPTICMYIITKPFRHYSFDGFNSSSFYDDILSHFNRKTLIKDKINDHEMGFQYKVDFDTFNTYYRSICLRSLNKQNIGSNNLTVEIDAFGNFKAFIPLNLKTDYYNIYSFYSDKHTKEELQQIKFIDVVSLLVATCGIFNNYATFLNRKGYTDNFDVSFELRNISQTSLFINTEGFKSHVSKYGIPICMKNSIKFPEYPLPIILKEAIEHPLEKTFLSFAFICNALGLPSDIALIEVGSEIENNQN